MNNVNCPFEIVDDATDTVLLFVLQRKKIGLGVFTVCLVPKLQDTNLPEEDAIKYCAYYDPDQSSMPLHAISIQNDLVNKFSEFSLDDVIWSYDVIPLGSGFAVQITFGDRSSMTACGLPPMAVASDECSD